MTTLVVYDSRYGNTEKVATAVGRGIGAGIAARPIAEVDPTTLPALDLLVVGSPTQGGQPSAALRAWLGRIPQSGLASAKVAAFDTRMPLKEQIFPLRALMGIIGFAAPRILAALKTSGGTVAAAAEGFIVEGRDGPLREGELERAARWGGGLTA